MIYDDLMVYGWFMDDLMVYGWFMDDLMFYGWFKDDLMANGWFMVIVDGEWNFKCVNPGLINHGLSIGGYSPNSHNLVLKWYPVPPTILQLVYFSRVDTNQPPPPIPMKHQ